MSAVRNWLLVVAFGCVFASTAISGTAEQKSNVEARMLPMAMIWYSFNAAYGQASKSSALDKVSRSLESSLSTLKADIPTKLAFVRGAAILESDVPGSRALSQSGDTIYVIRNTTERDHQIVVVHRRVLLRARLSSRSMNN
jgi:hypothetical protein